MNYTILTFDIDWVPDFIINFVAEKLIEKNIPATWFVTHPSIAVERLKDYPELFELGIHPNFRDNSSHGKDPLEVIHYCLNLVPDARTMRTHGLIQSISLFDTIIRETQIIADVTTYMPHTPNLIPAEYWREGRMMLRIPTYWQDELEMTRPQPIWEPDSLLNNGTGIKVFNFHPIHVYLNSIDSQPFSQIIKRIPQLLEAKPTDLNEFIHQGTGTLTLLQKLLDTKANFIGLGDFAQRFMAQRQVN
jgi:hypothetical protein